MEPSVKGEFKICTNGHGPFIKMAAVPVWRKNTKKSFFSRTMKAVRLNLGIKHQEIKVYQVCSNSYPRLTFDLFTARSNFRPYAFVLVKY